MNVRELLTAHRISTAKARGAETIKARETEFELIGVIARKLRSIRKKSDLDDATKAVEGDHTGGSKSP